MPVGGRLVGKLDSDVGMTAKAYQGQPIAKASFQSSHPSANSYVVLNQLPAQTRNDSRSDESVVDDDESTWALDEASQELIPNPLSHTDLDAAQHIDPNRADEDIVTGFLSVHQSQPILKTTTRLPCPIIIPQRRPQEADGGFVIAYPPLLDLCAGISQDTFLSLLISLNAWYRVSGTLDVINMAAFTAMFTPSVIALVTSFSVESASIADDETLPQVPRNTFLDRVNTQFFRPRGLWCMILTWKPEVRENRAIRLRSALGNNSSSHSESKPDLASGHIHDQMDFLSTSTSNSSASTTTSTSAKTGHLDVGTCAALIFPALDCAANSALSLNLSDEQQISLMSKKSVISEYLDRRQRAESTSRGVGSVFTATATINTTRPPISNRWSHPNHPGNDGTLLSLLAGSTYDAHTKRRIRFSERLARLRSQDLTDQTRTNSRPSRRNSEGVPRRADQEAGNESHGKTRRMIGQGLCYLVVVNLPEARGDRAAGG